MNTYPNEIPEENRFYYDEAYEEANSVDDMTLASTCDTCDNPAQLMTCWMSEDESEEYYICFECIEKYGLQDRLDTGVKI